MKNGASGITNSAASFNPNNYNDLLKMRKLRESFEQLTGISNMNNDLINRGKNPKGF